MPEPLLKVRELCVEYAIHPRAAVKAVDGVSFDLAAGEVMGIVGESGSGKSTLALAFLRLLPPAGRITGGQILFQGGNLVALNETELKPYRWKEFAIVFQNAMNGLSPVHHLGEQVIDVYRVHQPSASREEGLFRARELCEIVGLRPSVLDDYPHELSGGMMQRVMIALALLHDPKLLILDEATTGLDVITQAQIIEEMRRLQRELCLTTVVITHDVSVVADVCERVMVMYAGRIMELGSVADILTEPHHPYTQAFVRSFPRLHGPRERIEGIPGILPDLTAPPPGCVFAPRCSHVEAICREVAPPLLPGTDSNRKVACHIYTPGGEHSQAPGKKTRGE